ncbi:hypothetical protein EDD21DRAFT_407255 [Dissophora ornata]|nr:hypothetical protein EDD21DRAFT_407255 [Dissophora ornata]
MEEYQSFRVAGTTTVGNINVDNVDGQNIIYWDDIEQLFPGVQSIRNGTFLVKLLRDSKRARIEPLCIKHCPGVVLDVFLSNTVKHSHVDSPMSTSNPTLTDDRTDAPVLPSTEDKVVELLHLTPPLGDTPIGNITASKVPEHGKSKVAPMITKPGLESTVLHQLGGLYGQGQTTQEFVKQVSKDTQEIKDRLILIQSKTEAILTQNYELLEYTIPRLFIVLPETSTSWDSTTMLHTKFRLHFICECGEHTKATGSNIPHHLHLDNHEGYIINKPTEFFEKYGPFLMLMLRMIKLGAGIAGHVVPALANLKVVDDFDFDESSVSSVTSEIIKGVDYSLAYLVESRRLIKKSSDVDVEGDARAFPDDLGSYFAGVEGLEVVELRQLGSYLKSNNSDKLLGNLYRMTTKDGHIKWVCRHHYRASYQEACIRKLRNMVEPEGGVFNEQLGSIKVTLNSSFAAAHFYEAIGKEKVVVYDLDITFEWDCSESDLEAFEKALKMSSVSILRLDLPRFLESIPSKRISTSTRYEILVRIIEQTNMKMIHMVLSEDFVELPSLQPKSSSHLHKLSIEMKPQWIQGSDFQEFLKSLKTNNPLTTLNLQGTQIMKEGALALSEALKTNTTLTTLNLRRNSIGSEGAISLSEALKTNTALTTLDLQHNSIGKEGAVALSEALKTNITLTTLNLEANSIGNEGALALSEALKTNISLTTLNLKSNWIENEGALALSETLKTNTTLTTLDLGFNLIENEGALALLKALKTNTTLTTLKLRHNLIGDEGALALTNMSKAIRRDILTW